MKHNLQEYYRDLVSSQAVYIKKFLKKNDLLKFLKVFVWLEEADWITIKNGYINDIKINSKNIFSNLYRNFFVPRPNFVLALHLSYSISHGQDVFDTLLLDDNDIDLSITIKNKEELFAKWKKTLSPAANSILMKNEITNLSQFFETIIQPSFSFKSLKHCRQTTAEELNITTLDLIRQLSPMDNDNVISNDPINVLKTELNDCQLSMRAINCLKSIGVITIEDLLSTNCEELLLIRNCGNKTVSEIESFIISIKTKYGISKISSVPNNDVFSLQKESNSEKTKNITKIILSNLSISELSVRAQKCLEILKITTVEDLLALNQSNLTPLKNCGKKTISEIEELILLVKKKVGSVSRKKNLNICEVNPLKIDTNDNNPLLTIENSINNPVIEFISEADLEYANQYKSRYGYWPMVFILMRCIWNTLSTIEFAVFEYNYGMIPLHTEIDELTKYLAKDMFKEVLEKLRMNSSIKQLCRHEDWNYYYVNNIPIYVFDDENKDVKWERIGKLILQEKFFFNKYISEKKSTDEEDNQLAELLSIINLHTFKVFLQFWGHKPLWLDCSQNKLVPYCPQKEKMCHNPISPLVIERSFDSFMFNDAFAEIRRLQKIKTQDDIIISIRSYFIDNNDYWKKSVHLTNKDKAIFENILEELLIGICRANIVNGNLVIKANKIDVGEILYEILVDAKTRLHRDELLIRLRKMCHDKNLYCFTNSQQITYHLAKEPRIIAYGKSSYWGLKEWGESHSSIRELAVDYIKKSKTPIHIDELTKIILKTRPDSNENSISAIIRQTAANGELLLFFDDYVGYPQATYVNDYVLMPRSFKEWLKTFKEFVLKNKRYPLGRPNRYEGYLYRWHRKASQLRDLTPDEILQLDAMEKELSYYPHNTMEYNFLHNCDLYRKFVEGNNRMLEQTDDINLFKWFSNASIDYGTYEDNRKLYFSKLLQYISSKLY